MNRNIGILGSRGDSKLYSEFDSLYCSVNSGLTYGMPLPRGEIRDLEEEPLPSNILKTGLDDAKFHGT